MILPSALSLKFAGTKGIFDPKIPAATPLYILVEFKSSYQQIAVPKISKLQCLNSAPKNDIFSIFIYPRIPNLMEFRS